MPRTAKGQRPHFFDDPQVDKLLAIIMALAGEVSVLRERLDTVERLAEAKGVLSRHEIEAYRADGSAATERERWRADYLERILRVIHQEREALADGQAPPAYEQAIKE
jgi:hypothetical protein